MHINGHPILPNSISELYVSLYIYIYEIKTNKRMNFLLENYKPDDIIAIFTNLPVMIKLV